MQNPLVARPAANQGSRARARWLVTAGFLALFAVVLLRSAWISDDSYITLRTVDNWVNGYGPTWNVAERVQSYTHPLWMLLLSAAYFVTREAYFTTIVLTIVISLAALYLLMARIAITPLAAAAGALILILSKSFVDYSTSGLENALTHLLLGVFLVVYLRPVEGRGRLIALVFVSALLAVNRVDAVLLVLPPLLLAFYRGRFSLRQRSGQSLGLIALALAPLLAWEAFSVVYYGFLTPNTAFAKLNTGVGLSELIKHGLWYLIHSTVIDAFTSLALLVGSVVVLWKGKAPARAMVMGVLLYLAYVVSIGGDFMSGRFLSAPLYCTVAAAVATDWPWVPATRRVAAGVLAGIILLGLVAPYSPIWGDRFYPCSQPFPLPTGIVDERGCYFPGTGLVRQRSGQPFTPAAGLFDEGLKARTDSRPLQVKGAVGMYGYAAGPNVHVVDLNGLADPLLARLPVPPSKPWRIGHFERLVPAGYLETLAGGENRICNPGVAEFYAALALITRGPLLAPARLAAIWKMNTGQYDGLLANYGNPDALSTQLCNVQTSTDVQFAGGPKLVGYSVGTYQPKPGSVLPVTLYWQAGDAHDTALASFVHVRPSKEGQPANPASPSGMWAQGEHFEPGGRLTNEYWDGQVYVDQFLLSIPADIPAGIYNFEVGWFNQKAGAQLEPKPETVKPPHSILWRSILLPPLTVQRD
ncbi:MAG: hypothetical protein ACM30E_02890 [Nitrososphaerales archaeon]